MARLADLHQGGGRLGRAAARGPGVPQPPRRAAGDATGAGLRGAGARPDDPPARADGLRLQRNLTPAPLRRGEGSRVRAWWMARCPFRPGTAPPPTRSLASAPCPSTRSLGAVRPRQPLPLRRWARDRRLRRANTPCAPPLWLPSPPRRGAGGEVRGGLGGGSP